MGKFRDLTGQRFGRLYVVREYGRNKQGKATWLCKCDCGNTKAVYSYSLISGATLSCGCLHKEKLSKASKTHGMTKSRIYKEWANMKSRCNNPKSTYYEYYGGRGIKVCEEWGKDFISFYYWAILHGYVDNLTLDRKDTNSNYEPSNCRWVTMKEQANNKRNNCLLTYKGKTQTVAQWTEETGISYYALIQRIHLGWSAEKILTAV